MKRVLSFIIMFFVFAAPVFSQGRASQVEPDVATDSSSATSSATSSSIVERVVEKKPDITEPTGPAKSKLERFLEENPTGELSWNNPLRYAIFQSVRNGVPVNTIVLILLFPLVVAMVAASRHLIGIRGIGILVPSLLSVGFLATGISAGVFLFLIIIIVATLARIGLRRLKLQYLPRMALLLWIVSFGVFGAFFASSYTASSGLLTVGIFPILILMLLAESFIDVQVGRSFREAASLITTTFVLAIVTSYVISLDFIQKSVLIYPEVVFLGVGVFDYFMAKYVGLRLVEYMRFRPIFQNGDDEE